MAFDLTFKAYQPKNFNFTTEYGKKIKLRKEVIKYEITRKATVWEK